MWAVREECDVRKPPQTAANTHAILDVHEKLEFLFRGFNPLLWDLLRWHCVKLRGMCIFFGTFIFKIDFWNKHRVHEHELNRPYIQRKKRRNV